MRLNVGAFLGGAANGWQRAQGMERTEQIMDRERREDRRKDSEEATYKALADLAEGYMAAGAPRPDRRQATPAVSLARAGISSVLRESEEPVTASPMARGINTPGEAEAEPPGPKTADDRLGYALHRQPALFTNPRFLNDAGTLFLRAGMPQGIAWLDRGAKAQQENGLTALRALTMGDAEAAKSAFNAAGSMKIETLEPLEGGKWRATMAGGRVAELDPRQMYRSFLSPREFLDLDRRERADTDNSQHRQRTLDATIEHRNRTFGEAQRHNQAVEGNQRESIEQRREAADRRPAAGTGTQPTALQRNVDYLVKIGVAKNPAEAYTALRTAMGKPEPEAILGLTKELMRQPGYMGRDGQARAQRDATELIRSLRQAPPASGGQSVPPPASRPPLSSFQR
jgi:hypothetical protein